LTPLHDSNVELLLRIRNNDEGGFRELFTRYNAQLHRFVYRFLKDRDQSADVVQETFINLWQSREKLDARYSLEAYVFTIAKRLTLNYLRKETNGENAKEAFWQRLAAFSNETEDAVLLADFQRQTEALLAMLPPQQKLVFRLSRYEGLTHDQIAQQLNISPHTVHNHLTAALKTIREGLQQSGLAVLFLIYFSK
jgi:RNA polymerase sigma-70 factor (family 1)